MTSAATADRSGDRLRHGTVYANMRWRDENIRATAAHRAWAVVRTEGAWQAYQDAINLEQETWLSYVKLAQRLGDHAGAGRDCVSPGRACVPKQLGPTPRFTHPNDQDPAPKHGGRHRSDATH